MIHKIPPHPPLPKWGNGAKDPHDYAMSPLIVLYLLSVIFNF